MFGKEAAKLRKDRKSISLVRKCSATYNTVYRYLDDASYQTYDPNPLAFSCCRENFFPAVNVFHKSRAEHSVVIRPSVLCATQNHRVLAQLRHSDDISVP